MGATQKQKKESFFGFNNIDMLKRKLEKICQYVICLHQVISFNDYLHKRKQNKDQKKTLPYEQALQLGTQFYLYTFSRTHLKSIKITLSAMSSSSSTYKLINKPMKMYEGKMDIETP